MWLAHLEVCAPTHLLSDHEQVSGASPTAEQRPSTGCGKVARVGELAWCWEGACAHLISGTPSIPIHGLTLSEGKETWEQPACRTLHHCRGHFSLFSPQQDFKLLK